MTACKILRNIRIILVYFFLIFFISCKNDKSNVLNKFYDKLEKRVEEEKILKFKNTSIDSSEYVYQGFYHEYRLVYAEEVESNKNVLSYLKELRIAEIGIPRDLYLIYEFHNRLNKENHTVEDYEKVYKTNYQKRINEDEKEEKINRKESLDFILKDKQRWAIGDTLRFIFPVETDFIGNNRSTLHKLYPYTLDYSDTEDTLKLKAILTGKLLDSFDLVFKLKVLEISDENVFIFGSKYEAGDEFNFPLKIYGRPIE